MNFATSQATVRCEPPVPVEELVAAVESIGYGAAHPAGALATATATITTSRSACSLAGSRSRRPHGAGRPARDGAVAPASPAGSGSRSRSRRRSSSGRGSASTARRCGARATARRDGHADLARHARRLGWSAVVLVAGLDGRHVLRGRGRGDDADPARPLPRGAREAAAPAQAIRALLELGAKDARVLRDGAEVRVPVAELARRRPLRRAAGREDRDRRRRRRGRVGGRPVAADRRVACRSRSGPATRSRARRSTLRPARRPRDAGRRRHGARADRAARRGGAVGQGAGAAARRPGLGRLRAGRDRRSRWSTLAGWLAFGALAPATRSPPPSPC